MNRPSPSLSRRHTLLGAAALLGTPLLPTLSQGKPMSAATRPILQKVRLPRHDPGPGFTTHSLRAFDGGSMDPFLNLDDFHMSRPTFPPHPHAGFSAVTYMFPDSPGAFINRDSLGDRSRIGPGALHWTQAASGMMHEEIPEVPGTDCHGLQMFVNLSAAHKRAPPRAFHVDARDIPLVEPAVGTRVRVVAGQLGKTAPPLSGLLTPITLLDVTVEPGHRVTLELGTGGTALVMGIHGRGTLGGGRDALGAHEAALLASHGGNVELTADAGGEGLQVLVGTGTPLGEPVVFGGPFAMTTRADVDAAVARFRRGEMGHLEPSF